MVVEQGVILASIGLTGGAIGIVFMASIVPARRATRVDPMKTLAEQ